MNSILFTLLVFGFIFSGEARLDDIPEPEEVSLYCESIFSRPYEKKCEDKFNIDELYLMYDVLSKIEDEGKKWFTITKEEEKALSNILSISSKPLIYAFERYSHDDFEDIRDWIEKHRVKNPFLVSNVMELTNKYVDTYVYKHKRESTTKIG